MNPISLSPALSTGLFALQQNNKAIATAMERLATGQRINRAADDPSGAIAKTNLDGRISAITREIALLERGRHRLLAKDGALNEIGGMLTSLRALTVEAANKGALGEGELEALQEEADGIVEAISFVMGASKFNGEKLFAGSADTLGSVNIAIPGEDTPARDPGAPPPVDENGNPIELPDPPTVTVGLESLKSGGLLNLIDGDLEAASALLDNLVTSSASQQSSLATNLSLNFDAPLALLRAELEGNAAVRSLIADADFAVETANLARGQVLAQAAVSAISVARDIAARGTLGLLG